MSFIKTRDDDETANLIWNDSAVQHEKIAELRNYQVSCEAAVSSGVIESESEIWSDEFHTRILSICNIYFIYIQYIYGLLFLADYVQV